LPPDEHELTLRFAEIALNQIRALHQPASPRNFEFWYEYATGYNPSFNQSVNERMAQNGALGEADIDQLYVTFIDANRANTRIDKVGSRVLGEIKQIVAMLDGAAGSATSYSQNLADVSEQLAGATDTDTMHVLIERLVVGARQMEDSNRKLEARLSASKKEIEELQRNLEAVRSESLTDPLTALGNRKFFDAAFERAVAEAKANNEPLSLMMTDVDNFKQFNDRYGHQIGDQVLRLVAMGIKETVKAPEIAARYGGEEFAIALPATAMRSALTVADHIRRALMTKELMKRSTGERLGRVTLSIGVAVLRPGDTPASLMERADSCLYAAKRDGRNRVTSESNQEARGAGAKARVA
jgi:diguanylate cyclase